MARGKKTGGKNFKPGQSGNPKGMPPMSPEKKALRKITNEMIADFGDMILLGRREKLKELTDDPETPAMQAIYARATLNAMDRGDIITLEMVLNRVVGKVKERHEHTGKDEGPIMAEIKTCIEERIKQVKDDK